MSKLFRLLILHQTCSLPMWIFTFILLVHFSSCRSAKTEKIFNDIKKGNQLDKAQEIGLDSFMVYWIKNECQEPNWHYILTELYEDSTYTYFGQLPLKYKKFYKIKKSCLKKVDYNLINGDSIREKFCTEIIKEIGKNINKYKGEIIGGSIDFKYNYIESEYVYEIFCHYKMKCDFITMLNKYYIAKYDIKNKRFIKEKTIIDK